MPAAGPALWPLLQTQSKRFDIVYVLLSIRALQITGRRGNLLVLRKLSPHIPLLSLKLAMSFHVHIMVYFKQIKFDEGDIPVC